MMPVQQDLSPQDVSPAGRALGDVIIEMKKVNKWYEIFHALRDVDLEVRRGERIVICGPSGSGKSTLIRCLNQLEEHQKGQIIVDGVALNAHMRGIENIRREIGMVFQSFNLFPHLTAMENCMLAPMKVRGMSRDEARRVAQTYLERVHIPEQADKYPIQLSGGHAGPDGIEMDAEDGLVVCHLGVGIWRFDSNMLPTHLVHAGKHHRLMTNIAFRGKTLYVTDSMNGEILTAEMPVAGKKLFSMR